MTIELNRAAFRRLVLLYIGIGILTLVALICQELSPNAVSFAAEFDNLVFRFFGGSLLDETTVVYAFGALIALVIWMLASTLGLLWFKRWARFGFWASMLAVGPMMFLFLGIKPTYRSVIDDSFTIIGSALFGAILLLAYAKGYGDDWFAPGPVTVED